MKKHSRYILSLILLLDAFAYYLQASGNPSSRRPVSEKTSPDDQSNIGQDCSLSEVEYRPQRDGSRLFLAIWHQKSSTDCSICLL